MANKPFFQTVSSLVQGISRQAPGVRYPGQFEHANNITFNIVDGARKRHGTVTQSRISGASPSDTYSMHRIERDDEEEYLICYGKGLFKIYDVNNATWIYKGNNLTFADSDAESYLAYASPDSSELAFTTIADTTFIANKKRTTRTLNSGSEIDPKRMPIKLQRTQINPTKFVASTAEWKERSYHQQVLSFGNTPNTGGFKLGYLGSTVSKRYDPNGGTIILPYNAESNEISEYLNGNGVGIEDATDKNEAITGLNTIAYGKVIVTGGPIHKKDITITFSPDLDVDTLVTVHSNTTGQSLSVARGSDDKDPAPMIFTDSMAITNLAYYRNRLALTADEVVVFSATDDIFNFYQETPGTLVDSDPIVAQLAATDVCIIDSIIPFRNAMILLTKAGQQFELGSGEVFSPSTASVTPSTRYQTQSVQPVQIGDRLYMVGVAGSYSTLLEYYYDDNAVSNKAADITKHVDDLIPPTVLHVESAQAQETVMLMPTLEGDTSGSTILSNGTGGGDWSQGSTWSGGVAPGVADNAYIVGTDTVTFDDYPSVSSLVNNAVAGTGIAGKLFLYRSYSVGQERKQSAWTIWNFETDALMDCKVIDDELFLLRRQTQGDDELTYLVIETIDMSESRAGLVGPAGQQWNVHVDHRQGPISGSYDSVADETRWTLTHNDNACDTAVCADGTVVDVSSQGNGTYVTASGGNYTSNGVAYIGRKIVSELVLSRLYARDDTGKPYLDGRTKSKKLIVNHENSGDYDVVVSNSNTETNSRTTTHSTVDPLGISSSGELTVWTHGKNTEVTVTLTSDNPKPVTWVAMEQHGEIDQMTEAK